MSSITVKLTSEQHAKVFDEQKRQVVAGSVSRVTDVSATKLVSRALLWALDQPDAVKDQIFNGPVAV